MPIPADLLAMDTARTSEIKAKGWAALMRRVRASGAVLVTGRNRPAAVVLEAEAYLRLVTTARAPSTKAAATTDQVESLRMLQAEWDERMASPAAVEGMARALARPPRRGGAIATGKPS